VFQAPKALCPVVLLLLAGGCHTDLAVRHEVFVGGGYIVIDETNQVTRVKVFGLVGGNFLSKAYLTNRIEAPK
jgi:hypothetical protein